MKTLLPILLILCFAVSCNSGAKKKQQIKKDEIRIISLAPSVTKEVIDLGMKDNLVGCTSYCDISKENPELIIGSAMEVNMEKILLLRPTLVLASGLTDAKTITTLQQNGIQVHCVKKQESFEIICQQFLEVGKLLQKDSLALAIIDKAKIKVDSLVNSIPQSDSKPTMLLQIGAKPLFSVIPNTFMDDYITFAACENIASDMIRGTITRETVLQRNPDLIFITTMGGIGIGEKKNWERYTDLKAVKNNRIFIIESEVSNTPTVLSFVETLEIMINHIYN